VGATVAADGSTSDGICDGICGDMNGARAAIIAASCSGGMGNGTAIVPVPGVATGVVIRGVVADDRPATTPPGVDDVATSGGMKPGIIAIG
jgi:hypothetical protein